MGDLIRDMFASKEKPRPPRVSEEVRRGREFARQAFHSDGKLRMPAGHTWVEIRVDETQSMYRRY